MTDINYARLRALAEAATPGPWYASRPGVRFEEGYHVFSKREPDESDSHDIATHCWGREESEYIAAIDPSTLIALLDRLEELEGREPEWEYAVRNLSTGEVFEPVNGRWWRTTDNEEPVRRRKAGEWEPVTGDDDA